MKGNNDRFRNEELWQKMREEVIYVITNNNIKNKDELIKFFEDNHSKHNLDLDDLEIIIKNSPYINKLLK
ncbi:hypothetical protein LJB88_05080 [Erysipelotrichaceae bacterium OttesenSCG-928-M19]|nr:hypothetical protein [Erysipelotrichaceae bacterium OttesenSCG-928-M19]